MWTRPCAAATLALALAGCGEVAPTHQLTYEVTGDGLVAEQVTVDPPGEQEANAVAHTDVSLPWSIIRDSGYGFASVTASGDDGIGCRILDAAGTVLAEDTGADGQVDCRASIQDG